MGAGDNPAGRGPVLHILPFDLARGAQRYARALVDRLDTPEERHLIVTLFCAEPVLLNADVELDVPRGWLRRLGLDPRVILRLRRAFDELGPSLLIAHGGEPAKYAAIAAPRDMPMVYLSIGSAHPNLRRPLSRALHRRYVRRANVVVAVSSDVAAEAVELHSVPAARLLVIPNGRDPEVFRPGDSRRPGPTRLIFVGHLDSGKRPDRFIELVAQLRERGIEVEASMVGEGPLADDIRPAADQVGVVMLGRRDDVPALLADSDLLIMTSRPPEGMPGVLIEAALSGLPAVSTRIPGSADVIEEGVTGLLVDVSDFDALVGAVQYLVTDDRAREEMGSRARQRSLERFTLDATSGKWREVISELTAPSTSTD